MYTPSYFLSELFPMLKHCWCKLCPTTLLRCSWSWNIADVYIGCLITLLSWSPPKISLNHILSYYKAELFPILKHWWCTLCLITKLRCSRFWNIVFDFVEKAVSQCIKRANPYLYTLRRTIAYAYTLQNTIANLIHALPISIPWLHILIHALPILIHQVGFRVGLSVRQKGGCIECVKPTIWYDVRSELIVFDDVL